MRFLTRSLPWALCAALVVSGVAGAQYLTGGGSGSGGLSNPVTPAQGGTGQDFSGSTGIIYDAAGTFSALSCTSGILQGGAPPSCTTTPALGTPVSGVATNLTGTAAGLTAGNASAVPFSGVTAGTNAAALAVGTGGSLTVSGSGTINATTLGGATFAAPGTIGGGTPGIATFTALTATGQTVVQVGSAAAPSIKVTGTTDGLYGLGAGNLGVSIAGALKTYWDANHQYLVGSDVSLVWNTDGAGAIGAAGGTRPDKVFVKTSTTSPLLIGGTGTTQTLTYKTTTGVGASGADHIFVVGNDGATEALRIKNDASITVGGTATVAAATCTVAVTSITIKNGLVTAVAGTGC